MFKYFLVEILVKWVIEMRVKRKIIKVWVLYLVMLNGYFFLKCFVIENGIVIE